MCPEDYWWDFGGGSTSMKTGRNSGSSSAKSTKRTTPEPAIKLSGGL